MDLPYPTQRQNALSTKQSNLGRARSLVLKQSQRHIPEGPPLSNSLKTKIKELIMEDYAFELKQLIDRQVISLKAQVGNIGHYQNFLHLTCKYNAVRCLDYLLKNYYQYFQQTYKEWVNAANRSSATPVILCVNNSSNQCLELLLKCGGVDIHLIDSNKLSPYQLALNMKNEFAVKILMDYQGHPRGKQLNKSVLLEPYNLYPTKPNICQSLYRLILDCFCVGGDKQNEKVKSRKAMSSHKSLTFLENEVNDHVVIGYVDQDQLIQWRSAGKHQLLQTGCTLFETFCPFDIQDIYLSQPQLLIVLQSLSQHPWMVRRIIQHDKKKTKFFPVTLFPKQMQVTINIDQTIPFNTKTNQPMFIADKRQAWPMLVQKALAKYYGSYYALSKIAAFDFLQALTGWPIIQKKVQSNKESFEYIQQIHSEGHMIILEGKRGSLLDKQTKGKNSFPHIFNILNIYTRNEKKLILVNCPFVDPAWIEKQRHEFLALKILKGHFNCRDQMTVWIQQQRIRDYFSNILVVPAKNGLYRHTMPLLAKDRLFFRLQFLDEADQNVIIAVKDTSTGTLVNASSIKGWFDEKNKVQLIKDSIGLDNMAVIESKPGEYFFNLDVTSGKYQLFVWAPQDCRIHSIQECFGVIEWLTCWRQFHQSFWDSKCQYKAQRIGQYLMVVTKNKSSVEMTYNQILEGKQISQNEVRMEDDGQFKYCVVKESKTINQNFIFH